MAQALQSIASEGWIPLAAAMVGTVGKQPLWADLGLRPVVGTTMDIKLWPRPLQHREVVLLLSCWKRWDHGSISDSAINTWLKGATRRMGPIVKTRHILDAAHWWNRGHASLCGVWVRFPAGDRPATASGFGRGDDGGTAPVCPWAYWPTAGHPGLPCACWAATWILSVWALDTCCQEVFPLSGSGGLLHPWSMGWGARNASVSEYGWDNPEIQARRHTVDQGLFTPSNPTGWWVPTSGACSSSD